MINRDYFASPKDYKQVLHEGAANSLRLSMGDLNRYCSNGELPTPDSYAGLRYDYNRLLSKSIKAAEQRGAERERLRVISMLKEPAPDQPLGREVDEDNDSVVVPLRRRRPAR